MSGLTEEKIRTKAYELWRAAGEPEGKMEKFWYQAEKELIRKESELEELPPGITDNLPI